MDERFSKWRASDFGSAIADHIANGMWVFPVHGITEKLLCTCGKNPCGENNKNAGKHPYSKTAPNGFLNATNSLEEAAALFEYREDLNVGVATGKQSRIVVIDVDNKKDDQGDESLKRIEDLFGTSPATMKLGTGTGYHLVFDYPEGGLKTSVCSFGADYPGVDIRGDGGYIVIYPSRHYSGKMYSKDPECSLIADMPKLYVDFLRSKKEKKTKKIDRFQSSGEKSDWTAEQIEEALSFLDPDLAYLDWIFVGMGLHREGFPLDMWDKWSSRGKKYNGIADLEVHWRGFNAGGDRTIGTIIDWARVQGWTPRRESLREALNGEAEKIVAPIIAKAKAKALNAAVANIPERKPYKLQFCFDPMNLPGILGDTVRWIVECALYEQPELAMLNVLAFAGAVFGRKYASPIDTRTNVYVVAIADTGLGKEHSVKMTEILAMESGLINYVGENSVRSDIGIMKSVMAYPSHLMMVDEFGKLMSALSDIKASHHHRAVIDLFTKIYSKSSGVFKGGRIADDRAAKIVIARPNLCLYGVTTEKSYTPSLKRAAIDSGDLNRFIVIPTYRRPMPKRSVPKWRHDEDLFEWWKQFAPSIGDSLGALCNSATVFPTPKIVGWGECEERQYEISKEQVAHRDSTDENRNLWLRLHENTIKLAMIFAISRNPEKPEFSHLDFDYAHSIVKSSVEYMESLVSESIAETAQEESHHELLKAIMATGEIGMQRKDILRKFRRYRKRDIDELISAMTEEEIIKATRVDVARGRPGVIYHYTGSN